MSASIKNVIKSKIKNNYTCIISMLIVSIFMLVFMLIYHVAPLGKYSIAFSDCYYQMHPLLSVLKRKLENSESLFYYWNSGLGGDFLPSYFYYLSSPFNFLIVFFENIHSFISISVALKVILSAATFGYYLSHRNGQIKNSVYFIALSCSYALSNFVCGYHYQIMWLDSFMIFPLIMLGFEKLINDRKPVLYIVTLAYSLYCNYYISYIICLFLILYFVIDKHESIKLFFKKSILFAISSILAAGIAAVSLVPSFIGLTKTISIDEEIITHSWYGNIFDVIKYIFFMSKPIDTSYVNNNSNIYCGSIVLITISIFIISKEIDLIEKIKRLILLSILLLSMNESVLNYIWHGFHRQNGVPNRFAFIFIFLMLITAADIIDSLNKKNRKAIIIGLITAELLPLLSYIFVDFDSILTSHQVILLSSYIVLIYSILLIISTTDNMKVKTIVMLLLSTVIISEILFCALINFKLHTFNGEKADELIAYTLEAKNSISDNNSSKFYREDSPYNTYDNVFDNQNAVCDFNGVSVFNSTVNKHTTIFLQNMGLHCGINRAIYLQPSYFINDILGIKYIYSFNLEDDFQNDDHYKNIYSNKAVNVYENPSSLSLGYGINKNICNYDDFSETIISNNINSFSEKSTGINEIITDMYPQFSVSYTGCDIEVKDSEHLCLQYTNSTSEKSINVSFIVESNGKYLIDVREKNEDMVTIKINDQVHRQNIWLTNGYIHLGNLKAGDKVEIIVTNNSGKSFQYNSNISEITYIVSKINEDNYQNFIDILSKNQMEIESFNDAKLTGTINLSDNQLLFTTIPYDDGWHVYENDKELKKECLANTFIGLDLGPGNHSLTFKFIPQGLFFGIVITIISSALFIVLCIVTRKPIERESNNIS